MDQRPSGNGVAHNVRKALEAAPVLDSGSATARENLSTT